MDGIAARKTECSISLATQTQGVTTFAHALGIRKVLGIEAACHAFVVPEQPRSTASTKGLVNAREAIRRTRGAHLGEEILHVISIAAFKTIGCL